MTFSLKDATWFTVLIVMGAMMLRMQMDVKELRKTVHELYRDDLDDRLTDAESFIHLLNHNAANLKSRVSELETRRAPSDPMAGLPTAAGWRGTEE